MVYRRTAFELRKAEERAHFLEGLKIAISNLDAVVELIKSSANPAEAKAGLMARFSLSEIQAQAVLDMRLQRLTGLERDKIISEYNEFGIHRQAIRGRSHKVVWQRPADEAWYLRTAKKKEFFPSVSFDRETVHAFDLERDPGERGPLTPPLAPAHQTLLETLRAFVLKGP